MSYRFSLVVSCFRFFWERAKCDVIVQPLGEGEAGGGGGVSVCGVLGCGASVWGGGGWGACVCVSV